jgi:hypothetical protein
MDKNNRNIKSYLEDELNGIETAVERNFPKGDIPKETWQEPETKAWYLSKTIIGGLLSGVSAMLSIFKVEWLNFSDTEALATGIVGFIGAVMAIYGRIKADKKIK